MIKQTLFLFVVTLNLQSVAAVSINKIIRDQSPVKSQYQISSCSMFSAIALFEYKLRKLGYTPDGKHLDLSEQYLMYIVAGRKGELGAMSDENIKGLNEFGIVHESQWPFGREPWYKIQNINSLPPLAKKRCLHLKGTHLIDHCLIGRRDPRMLEASDQELLNSENDLYDPEFKKALDYARRFANQFRVTSHRIRRREQIKRLLQSGEPLLMDIVNYYQAWNRSRASSFGLKRDMTMFWKGVVSNPHPDSLDYQKTQNLKVKKGHSLLIVGYDPNVRIERQVESKSGGVIDVSTTGVFYFKNSFGTQSHGRDFTLNGERFPGYGMISEDYALDHGRFYQMKLNGK